jgi:predicted phage baseplate assembly protein
VLAQRPLTHAAAFDATRAASAAMRWNVADAAPQIRLESDAAKDPWAVRRDLLGSNGAARDFVVEVETDGATNLRFGDGVHATRPVEGTEFTAFYRVGNGLRGNVGAEAIAHVVTNVAGIDAVRNPLAATGGVDPETVEDVRRFAPEAFRTQERAVTEEDYAEMAERHPQVQQAAATFRWTGSWRTVFVTADPLAAKPEDAPFDPELAAHLEPYRMAGHDLEIDDPRYVPLEIDMQVCAKREYFRSDVKRALLDVMSSRVLADGTKGVFHADHFTFGQPVFLSRLFAAALAVDGVESVKVTKFRRVGTVDPKPLADGKLEFARLEIARLDNDPSRPERGVFRLDVGGGK